MNWISWKRYAKDKIYEGNFKKSAKQICTKIDEKRLGRKSASCRLHYQAPTSDSENVAVLQSCPAHHFGIGIPASEKVTKTNS
jgi:hypothetical protein